MKDIIWLGTTLSELRKFPADACREIGYNLEKVQIGLEPYDWKPMTSVGLGVKEIELAKKRYAELLIVRKK